MNNLIIPRIILLTFAFFSSIYAAAITSETVSYEKTFSIGKEPFHHSDTIIAATGLENSALGFCILAGLSLLGFSLTYLKK